MSRNVSRREHHQALLDEDEEDEDYSDSGKWKSDKYFDTQSRQNSVQRERRRMFYGYVTAVLGVVLLAGALVFSRALNSTVPVFEMSGMSFMAQFFMAVPLVACCSKCHFGIEPKYYGWLLLGCFLVVFISYAKTVAAIYLPSGVAVGTTLSLTLFFTVLFACCSKRRARWFELLSAFVLVIGIVLITQPQFIFRGVFVPTFGNTVEELSPCGPDTTVYPPGHHVEETVTPSTTGEDVVTQGNHTVVKRQAPVNQTDVTLGTSVNNNDTALVNTTVPPVASVSEAWEVSTEIPLSNVSSPMGASDLILGMPPELLGYGFCVLEALCMALHIVVVNKKLQGFNPFLYNAVVGFFGLIFCFLVMAFTTNMAFPSVGTCVSFLAAHIITAAAFGLFQYASFQMLPTTVSALLLVIQVPAAFLMELTAASYLELAQANVVEICGTCMVFLAVLTVPLFEMAVMNRKMNIRKL